jgi:hypothetical protein
MGPLPQANAVVRVINQSQEAASISWVSVHGETGTAPAPPCTETDRLFGPGRWQLTVTNSSATLSITLDASAERQIFDGFKVRADGEIARLTRRELERPPRPC